MRVSTLSNFIPRVIKPYPNDFLDLVEIVSKSPTATLEDSSMGEEIKQKLWTAYHFSQERHHGQRRRSGHPHFEHVYQVSRYLAEWNMDVTTVSAGLLHDTIEDTGATYQELADLFGKEVAELVGGVTKLGGVKFASRKEKQAENLMKMLLSMTKDIRVIIIKFADRLHNMQTLKYLPLIKQRRIAIETRDVYSPLAHRLGMYHVKSHLDDLVLKTLEPKSYREIEKRLKSTQNYRQKYIAKVAKPIQAELEKLGFEFQIKWRLKSLYSIYGKMNSLNKPLDEIYDIWAIRIIAKELPQCYLVLGIVHQLYHPVRERFKDFIATPKINGYQSLHTTVVGPSGRMVEIQIRTGEMDQTAEIGVAAHWNYKEERKEEDDLDNHIKWLRDLVNNLQSESMDPKEFMNLLRIDLYQDEVFTFTPAGDLIRLPASATPIDFAYAVHTEIGHHCLSAKMDGRVVPLNTALKSGSTVEIITSDSQTPSYAWLKLVRTSRARNAIKRWIRKTEQEASIKLGREILEKTLRRAKVSSLLNEIINSYARLGFPHEQKLFDAIGSGRITVGEILRKIAPQTLSNQLKETSVDSGSFLSRKKQRVVGIKIYGIDNMMVNFGKCCNPIPGDEIVGFVTHGKGIKVHQAQCNNLPMSTYSSDRFIEVEWDVNKKQEFLARLKVEAQDRKGYLKDITEAISSLNINITSVDVKVDHSIAICSLVIAVPNLRRLNTVLSKISKVPGTILAERAS